MNTLIIKLLLTILLGFFLSACSSLSDIDPVGWYESAEQWLFEESEYDSQEEVPRVVIPSEVSENTYPEISSVPTEAPAASNLVVEDSPREIQTRNNQARNATRRSVTRTAFRTQVIPGKIASLLSELFKSSDPITDLNATPIQSQKDVFKPNEKPVAVIQFANNSTVPDEYSSNVIKTLVSSLSSKNFYLVGHSSKKGGDTLAGQEYNMKLSISRAEAVRNLLINEGLSPDQIFIEGRGDNEPFYSEDDSTGEAANRRVDVYIDIHY